MKNVSNKIVLVTGAAMGLGKLFATRAVAENAAAVVLWDINGDALKETAAELEAAGGTVYTYVVDVSSFDSISEAAASVRDNVGTVEVLFNNAGIVRGNSYFWETKDVADIEKTIAINSLAPMYVAREFIPGMIESDTECRIVNIASSAGLVANPRMAVYAASKWAAVGFSDSIRLELEQAGYKHIHVTTVCPTYIDTGMFDGAKGMLLTPILQPEDVVNATWNEMNNGGPFVILPWTSRLNKVLSGVLPVKVRDAFLNLAGVYKSMEEFKGRER
jgi:all-trans-retinol dehydrogenase (NAD+)